MPSASSAPTLPFLERLLDGEKVEWKTLGEVCDYIRGIIYSKTAETTDSCGWKVLRANNITLETRTLNFDEVKRVKSATRIRENQMLYRGDILICAGSGSKDHIGKTAYIDHNMDCTFGGFMGVLRVTAENTVSSRFLFHYIGSSVFINYLKTTLKSSTINNLNAGIINPFPIPLPPLRVQARIVEILDKFTQLEAELEAELEARNKQYDFYRNRLLDFALRDDLKGQVEWKTLGEVCVHLRTGLNPRRNFKLNTEDASNYYVTVRELGGTELLYSEKTDLINDEALQLINNRSKLKVNDILFSGTGTIGKTAFISKEPTNWNIKEGVYALTLDTHYVLPMFVLRYLQTQSTIDWIDRMAAGGIVRSITMKNLEQLPIPLPPLSEQRRIVDILDRFDTLTNSISEGLPREIALRRKQYEYYRDALLRFPPPAPTA